jgi:cytochrome c oxidase accessory protein FixG
MSSSTTPSPLYASRRRIYPRAVAGTWRRIKWVVLVICLALYYGGAWLRWDRGPGAPNQALLIDMSGPRAYFFDLEIWPQEVYYLTGLLILAAIGLFLATSLFGRVWCGYACPQTVWTDLFMLAERWIEGDRNARIRRDKGPATAGRILRKGAKHTIWLLIAVATGGAWVLYFNDAPTVWRQFFAGSAGAGVYFFVLALTATTYLLAGWAREQVCTYMCPWPRFQAAMLDEHSFAVTYRAWRGEPRGAKHKDQSWEGRGDCVDCTACVQVCPTGIDIRNGPQLQCIGCGLCIDACDTVMDRVERPRGLIAWTTLAADAVAAAGGKPRYRLIRPRTIVYAAMLMLVAGVMAGALALKSTVEFNVQRDRSPQFVRLADGSIRNGYTLHILNKTRHERSFHLRGEGPADLALTLAGETARVADLDLVVPADSVGTFTLLVRLPASEVKGALSPLEFVLRDPDGHELIRKATVFAGPGSI